MENNGRVIEDRPEPAEDAGTSASKGGVPLLTANIREREMKRAEVLVGILKRRTGWQFAEVRQVLEMLPKDVLVEALRKAPVRRGR